MTDLTDRLAALPPAGTSEGDRARNALLCEALREAVEYSLKGQYRVTRYGHVEYLKAILAACEQEQRK